MEHSKSPISGLFKALLATLLKVLGISAAFVLRIAALVLDALSKLLEKISTNGKHH